MLSLRVVRVVTDGGVEYTFALVIEPEETEQFCDGREALQMFEPSACLTALPV